MHNQKDSKCSIFTDPLPQLTIYLLQVVCWARWTEYPYPPCWKCASPWSTCASFHSLIHRIWIQNTESRNVVKVFKKKIKCMNFWTFRSHEYYNRTWRPPHDLYSVFFDHMPYTRTKGWMLIINDMFNCIVMAIANYTRYHGKLLYEVMIIFYSFLNHTVKNYKNTRKLVLRSLFRTVTCHLQPCS